MSELTLQELAASLETTHQRLEHLRKSRALYETYSEIRQTVSVESVDEPPVTLRKIRQTVSDQLAYTSITQTLSGQSEFFFAFWGELRYA